MTKLKWFSGGQERAEEAVATVGQLLASLDTSTQVLSSVLTRYKKELERPEYPVPMILSAMNMAIAQAIKDNNIKLNARQTEYVKQLRSISYIRY